MAMVKCAECDNLVSNKTVRCPHCGYEPKGSCRSCQRYDGVKGFGSGRCNATEKEFVRSDKSVCPALIRKEIFDFSI